MTASRLPFSLTKEHNFYEELGNWIGDVFYDILPEKGFDLRDEQIFMAFQLERAFKEKSVMFAEAGVGTGKTIVYLLFAVTYARYTGKPAIIACADETLIEQLVKQEGDIYKIANHLDIQIDARLSKSHDQYLCLKKLEKTMQREDDEKWLDIYESLPSFVHESHGMQTFYPYGDRKEYPELTNDEWSRIGYDSFQDCLTCDMRHRCGLNLSRDHYRKATDLIICSHDFYMEHVWTKESRKREGQLPLLPEHSSVVFDEGHLLEFAAQKALTYRVKQSTLETFLERLLQNDIREEFAELVEDALATNDQFFYLLKTNAKEIKGSHRLEIGRVDEVKRSASELCDLLEKIGEALVFESEMYTIDQYELSVVEEYIEQMAYSLSLYQKNAISWLEKQELDTTFVVMPKTVAEVLGEKVFSQKIPYIFSSATLSENQSFDYLAESLGIKDYLSMSVASPYDYEEQMQMYFHGIQQPMTESDVKGQHVLAQVKENGGRSLILFPSFDELHVFRKQLDASNESLPFHVYFEGDEEISTIVQKFQADETSVLCSVHLWEGLDIPGQSLTNVVIWGLPYPPHDPVFEAKRNEAKDAFTEVDLPYMLLRLRQGIGRLIRTSQDAGSIHIYFGSQKDIELQSKIESVLPVKPVIS
ncbi:ATP-dependent DNA helicase [Bacillus altitudinis]|uniref:ATP-dependent DNA helicase n=1 Tax=Bacillus aerius TaxID=293388 RepID=A0AB39IV99_9BACI|nr:MULTISPECIES: ATP-dependent DNA helicase [Bacillus]KMK99934.1 ATP-dependent helicase [Bacillus stratosphericus]MBR0628663.1 ATP-dependent DNA helicase [Bacillus altitudinis S70-5-12]MBR0632678.1 ATP-dependent DNA helicase [Bacillus altitudinis C101]MBU4619676.1 ATP-dependent DNA helicase [Bacillus sp. GG161]MBW3700173.1 ATP-dependent DNA helicase [Bacillus aerophilus]MDH8710728.1 ATP-dependent DNA helicase DinG [Micromonospora sp. 1209]BAT49095.1 ATP-dependent helicase [Bacillus pumilus]